MKRQSVMKRWMFFISQKILERVRNKEVKKVNNRTIYDFVCRALHGASVKEPRLLKAHTPNFAPFPVHQTLSSNIFMDTVLGRPLFFNSCRTQHDRTSSNVNGSGDVTVEGLGMLQRLVLLGWR